MCKPFWDTFGSRAGMDCQMLLYRPIWYIVAVHGTDASPFPWQTIPSKLSSSSLLLLKSTTIIAKQNKEIAQKNDHEKLKLRFEREWKNTTALRHTFNRANQPWLRAYNRYEMQMVVFFCKSSCSVFITDREPRAHQNRKISTQIRTKRINCASTALLNKTNRIK